MTSYDLSMFDAPNAPKAPEAKYDLSMLDAAPSQPKPIWQPVQPEQMQAATTLASFGDATKSARMDKLRSELRQYLGDSAPMVSHLNFEDAQRQLQRAQMDHVLRDSPHTARWFTEQVQQGKTPYDVGTLANIERVARVAPLLPYAAARGAYNTLGGLTAVPGGFADVIGQALEPVFGKLPKSELTSIGNFITEYGRKVTGTVPEDLSTTEKGLVSGVESLGANLTSFGMAPFGLQATLATMATSVGGSTYLENLKATGNSATALLHGILDAGYEYIFEKAGGTSVLFDKAAWAKSFLGGVAKFAAKEIPSELVTTVAQKADQYILQNPERTFEQFMAEMPEDLAVTAIATLVGGGGQVAIFKGVEALANVGNTTAKSQAAHENLTALLDNVAKAELYLNDPESFAQFFQGVAGDTTVTVDPVKLVEAMTTAGVTEDALPSLKDQLNAPGEIELTVQELATAFAGTGAEKALLEHVRPEPDLPTLAESKEQTKAAFDAFQTAGEKAMARFQADEVFNESLKAVKEEIVADILHTGRTGKHYADGYGTLMAHFYATMAKAHGVTPLQIRDGWTDAEGVQHRGYNPRVVGPTGQVRGRTPAVAADFRPGRVANILNRDNWAVLEAGNPNGVEATPEENAAAMAKLKAYLDKEGIEYYDAKGSYFGTKADSLMLLGVTPQKASEIGNLFGQESIATRHGLVFRDGTVAQATGIKEVKPPTIPEQTAEYESEQTALAVEATDFKLPAGYAVVPDRGRFGYDGNLRLEYEGKQIGYLNTWFDHVKNEVRIDKVELDPEHQGKRLAKLAYIGLNKALASQGLGPLGSDTRSMTQSAINLWKSLVRDGLAKEREDGRIGYEFLPEEGRAAEDHTFLPAFGSAFRLDIPDASFENKVKLDEVLNQTRPAGQRARATVFSALADANTMANAVAVAKSQAWQTGRDLKLALDSKVRELAKAKKIDPASPSEDGRAYLVQMLVSEASLALEKDTRSVGWYADRVTRALNILSLIHPELNTDQNARFTFIWALAVTSNGLKVNKNFELAEIAYRRYKAEGKMPTDVGIGAAAAKINEGLGAYNTITESLGMEKAIEFMNTRMTVRDLKTLTGKKISGEGMDTEVLGAAVLGPKIGNGFFANLYGHFDQLTMDRWFVRTWGRWTGTLVRIPTKAEVDASSAKLKGLVGMLSKYEKAEFERAFGGKLRVSDMPALAQAITDITTKPEPREAMRLVGLRESSAFEELLGPAKSNQKRVSVGDEIRKLAIGLTRLIDGQKEAPGGSKERDYMRAVYAEGLAALQEEYPELTMSDLQAVMWYPEKQLYETAKLRDENSQKEYEDDEVPDYATAAVNLAKQKGVEVPRELATDQRPAVVRRTKPAASSFQQTGGRQGAQKPTGLTVTGVHFSPSELTELLPSKYGKGLEGAERARVMASKDARIKRRTHFYVSTGQGVFPEAGVGGKAHVSELTNLYDADVDALGLFKGKSGEQLNAAESAVLDAGYAGYVMRGFGNQGAAVVFGAQVGDTIPTKFVGTKDDVDVPPAPVAQYSDTQRLRRTLVSSKNLPHGAMTAAKWREYIGRVLPDILPAIEASGAFERVQGMVYRDELARAIEPPEGQFYQGGWYSPLSHAFENAKQAAMPGAQWASWLASNKAKLGLKDDEINFSGLTDYLSLRGKDKVTKAEISDYLSGNGVVVEDVVKGGGAQEDFNNFLAYLEKKYGRIDWWNSRAGQEEVSAQDVAEHDRLAALAKDSGAKFAGYWDSSYKGGIPGTYREILVTLPVGRPSESLYAKAAEFGYTREDIDSNENLRANLITRFGESTPSFKSDHWKDTPNVLVHVRLDEVMGADGKRYVRVGEVQSDWGQKGKKEGFLVKYKPEDVVPITQEEDPAASQPELFWYFRVPGNILQIPKSRYATEESARDYIVRDKKASGEVASAPFVTDTKAWVALGVKRAIMHAVSVGADGIVFGTGEQNANLYDLSKQVDRLDIEPYGIEANVQQYRVTAMKDGAKAIDRTVAEPELSNVVGKDIAKEAISGKTRFEGEGLRVGGEGMRAFYDKIVPQVANDVLKKLGGGKVAAVRVATPEAGWQVRLADDSVASWPEGTPKIYNSKRDAENSAPALDNRGAKVERVATVQPGFPITPEMREKVQAGMPLFQKPQSQQGPLGGFNPNTMEITLLANSNLSTFLHETGHFFLTAYADMAAQEGAPRQVVDDMGAILKWFGIEANPGGVPGEGAVEGSFAQGMPVDLGHSATNPGGAKLRALLDRAVEKSLRGVFDAKGNLYVWDAYLATHEQGARALGVEYSYENRVNIRELYDGVRIDADRALSEVLQKKYSRDPMVYFTVAGHGVLSGTEFSSVDGVLAQGGAPGTRGSLPYGRTPLEVWNAMSVDQQRPYHEQFAESFEQYLFSGKAPTRELQSLFQRFAKWLTRVYGSIREFVAGHPGAKIDPEMAAVMDRMLAAETEIAAAEDNRNYEALFRTAAEAGMTPAQFAAYLDLPEEARAQAEEQLRARSMRDMKWLQNRRNRTIAALQKEAAAARAEVHKEVVETVAQEPIFRAMRWLKRGELTNPDTGEEVKVTAGNKLSIPALEEMYPEGALGDKPDWRSLGYGQYGMLAKDGLHPDIVAEMFGFDSGAAMVDALLNAPKFKDEVEGLTDQIMLERHGDLSSPDKIAQAADEAIHNEVRTKIVATELSFLDKMTGSPSFLIKAAKEYARQLVANRTSKTLKAWVFAADEVRAGKAAAAALKKGDTKLAASHKRTELLNHAAVREAHAAEREIKAIADRLRKLTSYKDDDSAAKSRDMDMVNAVRAILFKFGFGTERKGKTAMEYLSLVEANDPTMGAVLRDLVESTTDNAKDWRTLKLSELRDLRDAVDAVWAMAKRAKLIEIDGKLVPRRQIEQELYDRLDEIGIPDRLPGEGQAVTEGERSMMKFSTFVAALRRVESWAEAKDGKAMGPFRKYIWSQIKDAADTYRVEKARYLKAYRELLDAIAPSLKRELIDAREIGYTFGKGEGGMGKTELLHALLHTGNASNKRKLLLGRGWATENADGTLDTSKWDAFIARMIQEGKLTKADYDFAQGVWDLLDSMKPAAQKAHRASFGRYFAEVTADAFATPFGDYRGGYVPAQADPEIVQDAQLRDLANQENENMVYAFPSTPKGFTKSRVEYNRPLHLDLRSLAGHIDKVLLFSYLTEPVSDVRRVIMSKTVSQALGRVDPKAIGSILTPWLNRVAKQVVEERVPGREPLSRFWSTVRSRAGMSAMFANIANSAQQVTGVALAAVKVRPKYLLEAMAHNVMSPRKLAAQVAEMSPYMRDRMQNEIMQMGDAIDEILLNPTLLQSAKAWSQKHAYFMQMAVDNTLSPMIWMGAFNQAKENGSEDLEARRLADSAVRQTQGSQAPEDIAAFESGTAFYRMFVQFAGYFNMNANLLGTEFVKLAQGMGLKKGAGRGLYVLALGFYVPAVLGELIVQAFRGGPDDDDKDGEYLDDWLAAVFGYGPARYLTAMAPVVGQAANALVNTLNHKPYDDRISTAPAISMIESAVKAPISVYKAIADEGKASKAVNDTATLISMTVGVPARAVAKPISYLAGAANEEIAPEDTLDAIRGTITGTASPASKQ